MIAILIVAQLHIHIPGCITAIILVKRVRSNWVWHIWVGLNVLISIFKNLATTCMWDTTRKYMNATNSTVNDARVKQCWVSVIQFCDSTSNVRLNCHQAIAYTGTCTLQVQSIYTLNDTLCKAMHSGCTLMPSPDLMPSPGLISRYIIISGYELRIKWILLSPG